MGRDFTVKINNQPNTVSMFTLTKEGEPDVEVSDAMLGVMADLKEAFRVDCGLYDVYRVGHKCLWKLSSMLTEFGKMGLLLNDTIGMEEIQDTIREKIDEHKRYKDL